MRTSGFKSQGGYFSTQARAGKFSLPFRKVNTEQENEASVSSLMSRRNPTLALP